jgi:drug/metabolite transporter (DMT)-like permease
MSAANEYWVVNWLKDNNVNLPIFMAIVQNASWPVQLLFYYWEVQKLKSPRIITPKMYRSYCFLGLLAAFIGLSRMYGLSTLPPTLYVICANTEIVFETAMTKFILHRQVSPLQYVAVFLVLSAVILSLYNPNDHVFGQGDSSSSPESILIGVGLSLASRFASSLNTILAEK